MWDMIQSFDCWDNWSHNTTPARVSEITWESKVSLAVFRFNVVFLREKNFEIQKCGFKNWIIDKSRGWRKCVVLVEDRWALSNETQKQDNNKMWSLAEKDNIHEAGVSYQEEDEHVFAETRQEKLRCSRRTQYCEDMEFLQKETGRKCYCGALVEMKRICEKNLQKQSRMLILMWNVYRKPGQSRGQWEDDYIVESLLWPCCCSGGGAGTGVHQWVSGARGAQGIHLFILKSFSKCLAEWLQLQ